MIELSEKDIFTAIFAISQESIDLDLAEIDDKIEGIRDDERAYMNLALEKISVAEIAASYHRRLLQGHAAWLYSCLSRDLLLYTKTLPAHQIAEMACTVACQSGRLASLTSLMVGYENEEGLEEGEVWSLGNGPQEYQDAAREGEELLGDITDTVFVEVLKRYRFYEALEMIEKNRSEYEIRYEVGRRLLSPDVAEDVEANRFAGEAIRSSFGHAAYGRLQARLGAAGFEVSPLPQ
jgi:hypothetical protein